MPSKAVKDRIAAWEGDSMRTNRSFEAEAKDFNRVIPENIRQNLSQEQLDALYSYGYNVGMGNLKERVLPALANYVNGRAGAEDVASHMWASRDSEPNMGGLRRRRSYEKSQFVHGSPSDRRQSVAVPTFNQGLSLIPSGNSLPAPVLPPNPTDYGTPVDYSSLIRTAPQEDTDDVFKDDKGMGLLTLMSNLGAFGEQQEPLASYAPPKNNSPFVVSAPTYNGTLLDDSWFANGGRLYAPGGVMDNNNGQAINHEFTYDNPFEYMGNTYPTSRMIVDGVERQVFAGGDGTVWAIGDNNLPYKVLYQHELPEVVVKPSAEDTLKRRQKDYLTMSNDATAVANGQSLNPHLNERGIQGAMAHAAWDKEHPNLAAWRDVATAVPFAVAAYPFAAGLGDMAAATSVSQGLTNIMNMAATTARNSTWLPWADAAISAPFAAHGVAEMSQGNFTPETVMEVAPVAQIFRPLTYSTKPRNPSRVANTSVSFLAQSPLVNSEGELGRNTFVQDLTSPWYRERWLKEVPNKQTVDKIINTMHSSAESAPFNYSKTASELGGNWGVTKRNKPRTESIYDKDGNVIWQVINNDTGMAGIDIASNDPEKAKTAYHELLHYTTSVS